MSINKHFIHPNILSIPLSKLVLSGTSTSSSNIQTLHSLLMSERDFPKHTCRNYSCIHLSNILVPMFAILDTGNEVIYFCIQWLGITVPGFLWQSTSKFACIIYFSIIPHFQTSQMRMWETTNFFLGWVFISPMI